MSITTFPLDEVEYSASALGAWCARNSRGIISEGDYEVTNGGDMSVNVAPGVAWLRMADDWGVDVHSDSTVNLTIDEPDGATLRNDAICLRLDKTNKVSSLIVKKGVTAVLPAIERNDSYDEIYLAKITVTALTSSISASNITDLRSDVTYCGIMGDARVSALEDKVQTMEPKVTALEQQTHDNTVDIDKIDDQMLFNSLSRFTVSLNERTANANKELDLTSQAAINNDLVSMNKDGGAIWIKTAGVYMINTRLLRSDGNAVECSATLYDYNAAAPLMTLGSIPCSGEYGNLTQNVIFKFSAGDKLAIRVKTASGTAKVTSASAIYISYLGGKT